MNRLICRYVDMEREYSINRMKFGFHRAFLVKEVAVYCCENNDINHGYGGILHLRSDIYQNRLA